MVCRQMVLYYFIQKWSQSVGLDWSATHAMERSGQGTGTHFIRIAMQCLTQWVMHGMLSQFFRVGYDIIEMHVEMMFPCIIYTCLDFAISLYEDIINTL